MMAAKKAKLPLPAGDDEGASSRFPPLPPGGPDVKLGCLLDADMYARDAALLAPGPGKPNGDWLNSSCVNFALRRLETWAVAALGVGADGRCVC